MNTTAAEDVRYAIQCIRQRFPDSKMVKSIRCHPNLLEHIDRHITDFLTTAHFCGIELIESRNVPISLMILTYVDNHVEVVYVVDKEDK